MNNPPDSVQEEFTQWLDNYLKEWEKEVLSKLESEAAHGER